VAEFRCAARIDGTHEPPELERAHDEDGRDEGDQPGCPRAGALSSIEACVEPRRHGQEVRRRPGGDRPDHPGTGPPGLQRGWRAQTWEQRRSTPGERGEDEDAMTHEISKRTSAKIWCAWSLRFSSISR